MIWIGSTYLLGDHGHGRALVEETELSVLVLGVARVPVDAAVEHGAVEVAHQGANVTGAVG